MPSRKLMPSHSINGAMTVPMKDNAPSPRPDAPLSDNSTEKSTIQIDEESGEVTETFSRGLMESVIDEYISDASLQELFSRLNAMESELTQEEQQEEQSEEKVQVAFKCTSCNSESPCMFTTVMYKRHVEKDPAHAIKPLLCEGQREPNWIYEYTIPYVE